MADAFEYISRARLQYREGYRHAYLGEVAEPVVYGVQGALRAYYGVKGRGARLGRDHRLSLRAQAPVDARAGLARAPVLGYNVREFRSARRRLRMNAQALGIRSLRDTVSPDEWAVRVDLAACYRLVAHYDWEDLVFTHITARVPGTEVQFLINPYGLVLDAMTASR